MSLHEKDFKLENESQAKIDEYSFNCELSIGDGKNPDGGRKLVRIVFEDGKFQSCDWGLSGLDTKKLSRGHWNYFSALNNKIKELEVKYEEGKRD